MEKGIPDCTPFCESFRCNMNRGALRIRQRSGKKEGWCTSFEDVCDGAWCQYSRCESRRMADGGKCKGRLKPQPVPEMERDEPFIDPSQIPEKYQKKLRGKLNS
ncbi:MAG: hypothetical protein ACFFEF_11655 [Candidatus Thorarchaeota archaeon]